MQVVVILARIRIARRVHLLSIADSRAELIAIVTDMSRVTNVVKLMVGTLL